MAGNGFGGFGTRGNAQKPSKPAVQNTDSTELPPFIAQPTEEGPYFPPLGYISSTNAIVITRANVTQRLHRLRATAELRDAGTRFHTNMCKVIVYELHAYWNKINGRPGNASAADHPIDASSAKYAADRVKFMAYVKNFMNAEPNHASKGVTTAFNIFEAFLYINMNLEVDPVYYVRADSTSRNVVEDWRSVFNPARYRIVGTDPMKAHRAAMVDRTAYDLAMKSPTADAFKVAAKAKFKINKAVTPVMPLAQYGAELHGALPSEDYFKLNEIKSVRKKLRFSLGDMAEGMLDWKDSVIMADAHVYAIAWEMALKYLSSRYLAYLSQKAVMEGRFSALDVTPETERTLATPLLDPEPITKCITKCYNAGVYEDNKLRDGQFERSRPWLHVLAKVFAKISDEKDVAAFKELQEDIAKIEGNPTVKDSMAEAEAARLTLLNKFVDDNSAVIDMGVDTSYDTLKSDPAERDRYYTRHGGVRILSTIGRINTDKPIPGKVSPGFEIAGRSIFDYQRENPASWKKMQLTNSNFTVANGRAQFATCLVSAVMYGAGTAGYLRMDFDKKVYFMAHSTDPIGDGAGAGAVKDEPTPATQGEPAPKVRAADYPNSEDDGSDSDDGMYDCDDEDDAEPQMTTVTHSAGNPVMAAVGEDEMEIIGDAVADAFNGQDVLGLVSDLITKERAVAALDRWRERTEIEQEAERKAAAMKKVTDAAKAAGEKATADMLNSVGEKRAKSDEDDASAEAPNKKIKKLVKKVVKKKMKKAE